jgi:hypothetical protein
MHFIEANHINRVYVTSPYDVIDLELDNHGAGEEVITDLPRREIADPEKLLKCIQDEGKWNISKPDGLYYVKKINWRKRLKTLWPEVDEGDFYIMCQIPQMFRECVNVSNVFEFLEKWWDTPFLITTSIYHSLDDYTYGIPNGLHPPQRHQLRSGFMFNDLLKGRCYTIANGLTLILAMHRLRVTSEKPKEFAGHLLQFIGKHDYSRLYQKVDDVWGHLYYGHSTHHIADFPCFYVCMGPKFAHPLITYTLLHTDAESIPNVISTTRVVFTSYKSAMLPYLHGHVWNNLMEAFVGKPDIIGMLTAIVCNRSAWKWWCSKGQNNTLRRWISNGHIVRFLKSSFILYNNGSDNGNVCRSRLRKLWDYMITEFGEEVTKVLPLVIRDSPYTFMQSYIANIKYKYNKELMLMRECNHPYFQYNLNDLITQKLLIVYRAFGLGKKAETFPGSTIIGDMLLEKMKQDRSILY